MYSLIVDSSSEFIKMGVFKGDTKLSSIEKKAMALESFFSLLSEVCEKSEVKISKINEFIFCEGTGSVLGIRYASVSFFSIAYLNKAKVFSYKVFDIARYLCAKKNLENCQIICDSKKGFYNFLELGKDANTSPQELSYEEFEKIKSKEVFYIKQREKQVLKEGFKELSYSIDDIFEAINSDRNFYLQEQIEVKDALLLSKREFVKWNSQAGI